MFLQNAISKRIHDKNPVKVALIGAGKFGSMFLSQVPSTIGLEVSVIADLKPENAIKACKNVGWNDDLIKKTKFVDQGVEAITETSKPFVLGTWLKNIEPNLPAPIRATFTGFLSSILFNIAFCKNILLPIN